MHMNALHHSRAAQSSAQSSIDAVIPYHAKDRAILPLCLQGLRANLPVARVLIVCAAAEQAFVEALGCEFVDQDTVIAGLTRAAHPGPRYGWYFQQLLKLGMADLVNTSHYLVVDSDTVFLHSLPLLDAAGRVLLTQASEYHRPYFDTFERLLGFPAPREYSFVAHHMIFDRELVRQLRGELLGKEPWYAKIMAAVGRDAPDVIDSRFSEYETYGHYLKACHPDEFRIRTLKWSNVDFPPTPYRLFRLGQVFDYCSFHRYLRDGDQAKARLREHFKFETWLLGAAFKVTLRPWKKQAERWITDLALRRDTQSSG